MVGLNSPDINSLYGYLSEKCYDNHMKAIITTVKDLSADIFGEHGWDIYFYDKLPKSDPTYDTIYLRDPFNDENIAPYAKQYVEDALRAFRFLRSIDSITSYDQMKSFEDKYNQFMLYSEYMPNTFLPSAGEFCEGEHLAKKRISQRAKGIYFEKANFDDSYIIQDLMDIQEELRVYAIFGNLVEQATIRSSKSPDSKVKVVGKRNLTEKEKEICGKIVTLSKLDFIGIDLAVLKNGELKLIEVNRSPQFKRFVELYGEAPLSGILDL